MIRNGLIRSILCRRLHLVCLPQQINADHTKIQKLNYTTTVVTSKDVAALPGTEAQAKLNKAAQIFTERAREYDEMIEDARAEYRIGMRHLANMMGADPETFTQKDADAAIRYLFPSGLYDKKARPFMKPPEEVFPPRKKIQFDNTGRPFHYMFFTRFPVFYDLCNQALGHFETLNKIEDNDIRQNKEPNAGLQLKLDDSAWLTKEQLQDKIIERISDKMYEDFLIMMNRLIAHPYSYHAKDFIMSYRKTLFVQHKGREVIQPKVGPDGRNYVTTFQCRFKSCIATVTVISPGTGKIEIDGKDINGFKMTLSKETISNVESF